MFVKAGWGLAGGILLLLTIFGQRVFPVGGSTAAGIGVLYGARGIGAALGPILLRYILGQKPSTLRRAIGPAYFIIGVFYAALSVAPGLPTAAVCVLLAHFGGSILWVFSTVLLQMEVPDRLPGPRLRRGAGARHADFVDVELPDRPRARRRRVAALGLTLAGRAVLRARRSVAADSVALEGIGRPPSRPDQTASAGEELIEGHMG